MEKEKDSDLLNEIEDDFNTLESYYDICLGHLKKAKSQEAVRRLLLFTESTVNILNRYAEKNPTSFKNLVEFNIQWPGMLSPITALQKAHKKIEKQIGVGSFLNLKGLKKFTSFGELTPPKKWAISLLRDINYEDSKRRKRIPFNKKNLPKWKKLVEFNLDLHYGTRKIRDEMIQRFLFDEKESIEAATESFSEPFDYDKEIEAPCLVSDKGLTEYYRKSLETVKKETDSPGTIYSWLKGKILEQIDTLAP